MSLGPPTMTPSTKRTAIILLLFLLTFIGLRVTDSVHETPIKQELSNFPTVIDEWRFVQKGTFSAPIIDMLGVADYISYDYVKEDGSPVNLYISYFTAVGVTGGYHSPQNCMPGGGWNMTTIEDVALPPNGLYTNGVTIKKAIVQKGAERQVVLYWFQNRGRIISSEYWEKIYLVLDAVFKQRRDGSFIRIIAKIPPNATEEAFTRDMLSFAQKTMEIATEFIPGA